MIALFSIPGRTVFEPVVRQCDVLTRAAGLLGESLVRRDASVLAEAASLRAEERKLVSQLAGRLCETLMTPLNHEDLMMLASWIRRVRREVTRATERVVAFGAEATEEMTAMAAVTGKSCGMLAARVDELRSNRHRLPADFFAFHRSADEASSIARRAVAGALSGAGDPVAAIKQYEIFGFLTAANRTARRAADWVDYSIIRNG